MSGIKNVFGAASISSGRTFGSVEEVQAIFELLKKSDTLNIDTAALYGDSEELLGKAGVADSEFIVDTKTKGGFDKDSTAENIIAEGKKSRELLKTNVDIFYIHAPNRNVPIEDTLHAVNEVYKTGFFKRFGLSNFQAEEVQQIYDVAKAKGYPLPSVYQGNYSPVTRKQEEILFPTLRKLNISFYAYSPLAGGFLTKTKEQIEEGSDAGRFSKNHALAGIYGKMYNRPAYLDALARWQKIAQEEGVPSAELAYRWVKYNSPLKPEHGDAIIVGASSFKQLEQTLSSIGKGPLSAKAVAGIDEIWKTIEHEAPLDNFHG